MTPTPVSETLSTGTPVLTPVSCKLAQEPFAFVSVSPFPLAEHAASSEPMGVVDLVPSCSKTRGYVSSDGEMAAFVDVAYGALSHRSYGSMAPISAGAMDDGSVSERSIATMAEEPLTKKVVSERMPFENCAYVLTYAL